MYQVSAHCTVAKSVGRGGSIWTSVVVRARVACALRPVQSPYSWITMRRALRKRRVFDFVPSYLKARFESFYSILKLGKACDFAFMQTVIAVNHTLKLGTHRPHTQSPKKVNLDNSKSNSNQSNNKQRLRLDRLRNSTWAPATTRNILLQKSAKEFKKHFIARFKAFLGVKINKARS